MSGGIRIPYDVVVSMVARALLFHRYNTIIDLLLFGCNEKYMRSR